MLEPLNIHSEENCSSVHPGQTHDEWWMKTEGSKPCEPREINAAWYEADLERRHWERVYNDDYWG